ncbi:ADP-ribosylglycohydrolase family protein [Halocatena salina]|uniref:ADP-ribosylglycohydrolase family protein n=1 Tax=Halocatena salina TaxID=2934340 RepID=A0A8U0A8M9_9EURY|nr:ADP-ribosylglycohydrolase family protein [Halocatena salina]UPM45324.1 ADP-ribosylglycohydrolase family protein [Halocatena salina]
MDTDHAEGVLLGLACGDALGRPVEFKSAAEIEAEHGTLREMVGHGTWRQPAGTVTDDTAQARCLARSVADRSEFDPADIADRFVEWYDTEPFDIGIMTRRSLQKLKQGVTWETAGRDVWEASAEGSNAGNGSVMRCPPLAVAYPDDPSMLGQVSRQSSEITHADPRCTYGCAVVNLTIAAVMRGDAEPLRTALNYVEPEAPEELLTALEPIARGDERASLPTSGYVIHTLQTALYDGLHTGDVETAIVRSVNRGGDTDTIGAVTGAIAGARFGATALPDRWLAAINAETELRTLAAQLMKL